LDDYKKISLNTISCIRIFFMLKINNSTLFLN